MAKEIACHLSISIEITSLQGWGVRAPREQKIRKYSAQPMPLMSYKGKMEAQAASTHFGCWPVSHLPSHSSSYSPWMPAASNTAQEFLKIDYSFGSKFHLPLSPKSLLVGSPWALAARGAIVLPTIKGREGTDFPDQSLHPEFQPKPQSS